MADSSAKRIREARKRQHREMKVERKRMRKEGLLGKDNTGFYMAGEIQREIVDPNPATPPPAPSTPSPEPPKP